MKTVVVLSILLCAAFAAPAENKEKAPGPEAAVALKEQMVPAPETEDKTMNDEKVFVPEHSVPVHRNAHVIEEAAAPEVLFNFCPVGWYSHGSRCFIVINTAMSWYNAEDHCNNMGGHLASATNFREYSFLQEISRLNGQSITWLGGFNLQGKWMWIDREGFYYTNWYSQSSVSSYACMYLNTSYGWRNTQCSSSLRFICSKNPFSC